MQSFLDTNRAGLAGAGIFQPRSLTWPSDAPHAGARALVAFARRDENPDDPVKRAEGATDEAGLLAWRTRLAAAFATELAAAPGNCDTILLSSEQCHSNLWRIDEVQAVHQLLAPFCDGFEVIVYLRAQHELAVSAYGMLLRDGHHDAVMLPDFSVPPLTKALRRHYFDHETLLARWSSVFGTKAMRVQLFARDTLLNGDIVDDFASLALPPGNWRRVARSNTNQSAAAQHLLIGLGRALAARSAGEAEHVRAWLVPRLAASAPGNGIRPTRDGVAGFMAQFAQANNRVRAAWFPARDQLFPIDLGEFPETELPAEDRLAAACTALIETILHELPR
ncbi:MAG: hypothetical protein NT133_06840 [Alphaproteobacteria bacterium]|nr:hypothetical protein [Alphaproteobacteria bacterium]